MKKKLKSALKRERQLRERLDILNHRRDIIQRKADNIEVKLLAQMRLIDKLEGGPGKTWFEKKIGT